MKRWHRYLGALVLAVAGGLVGHYTTDREFINLQPTPGADFVLPLDASTTYYFSFIVDRDSLTRLGLAIMPLRANLPGESVRIIVRRGDSLLADATAATPFIDAQGFTQIRFSPPIRTNPGEQLTTQIIVPESLSGALGVALRQPDGSFNPDNVQLRVNGNRWPLPLAYQAYFRYHPGLAIQVGALLIISAGLLMFPSLQNLSPFPVGLVVAGLALLPAIVVGSYPWWVWLAQACAWAGMYHLLAHFKLSPVSRLVGAHYSGLTTYWTLHHLGDTSSLLLLSVIPFAVYMTLAWPRYRALVMSSVVGLGITAFAVLPAGSDIGRASFADIFLDPYQAASAQKTSNGLPWHHYGSYIGIFGAALALVGLLTTLWRRRIFIGLLCGVLALYYSASLVAWPAAYTIIIVTYLIAYAAAVGMHAMQRYLGDSPIVRYLMLAVSMVILLDVLFVVTTTLETQYL